jgi:uncharacterized RDD family membrane protein YckC
VDGAVNEPQLASWGRRLAALVVDGLILGGLVLFTLLAAGLSPEEVNETIWEGSSLAVIALFVLPEAIYDTFLIGARNQTLGKMLLRIKVVDASGRGGIGYRRAFTRWISTAALWALWAIPGVVDHLWPLRDARNQTWHDKFARSVVVRT